MTCGIYKIFSAVNNRMYIGSSINIEKRVYEHKRLLTLGKHTNGRLQNSWNKYGPGAFVFSPVEIVADANFLLPREQCWIWRTNAHKVGYNIFERPQNSAGFRFSAESRAKMAAAKRGKPSRLMGRRQSKEHVEKLAAARRGRKPSPEAVAKTTAANKGRKHSPNTRARMSEAAIKREARRPTFLKELSIRNIGSKRSEETRARISAARLSGIARRKAETAAQ